MAVKENCSGQSLRNTTFLSQTKHGFFGSEVEILAITLTALKFSEI